MAPIVLTTPLQLKKGGDVFRSISKFDVREAPGEEEPLAEAVTAHGCRAVIAGSDPYTGPLYEALESTGGSQGAVIARFGVGHDNIDKKLAREHNILVTHTPGVLDVGVAEHTMWLLGNLVKRVGRLDSALKAGRYEPRTGIEVHGRTLGILGFGSIGRRVALVAHHGFGMRVLAADRLTPEELEKREGKPFDQIKAHYGLDSYTTEMEAVLPQADVVTLHFASNPQTANFINADRLRLMKPEALLVNTARGSVVVEEALFEALSEGRLAGAALDVFQAEPYVPVAPNRDLRTLENVVLTPHVASNTEETNRAIARCAAENVVRFFAGRIGEMNLVPEG